MNNQLDEGIYGVTVPASANSTKSKVDADRPTVWKGIATGSLVGTATGAMTGAIPGLFISVYSLVSAIWSFDARHLSGVVFGMFLVSWIGALVGGAIGLLLGSVLGVAYVLLRVERWARWITPALFVIAYISFIYWARVSGWGVDEQASTSEDFQGRDFRDWLLLLLLLLVTIPWAAGYAFEKLIRKPFPASSATAG